MDKLLKEVCYLREEKNMITESRSIVNQEKKKDFSKVTQKSNNHNPRIKEKEKRNTRNGIKKSFSFIEYFNSTFDHICLFTSLMDKKPVVIARMQRPVL